MRQQPEVRLAYLFGSHGRGTANPLSDVDVAVLLDRCLSPQERGQIHLRLAADLMAVLRRDDVDVVILNSAPVLLRHRIVRDGRLLFVADEEERASFVADTLLRYLDLRPMFALLERAMILRLQEGRFGRGQIGDSPALRKARAKHRQAQTDH
jgi:predicted nucleotidyltransferase